MVTLDTERLILRGWRDADVAPWAALNADPAVREFLGPPLTVEQSAASVWRFQEELERNGYGFWAVEVRDTGEFIGFTGLDPLDDDLPFDGVEAGWRLSRDAWGHGYATEAARAALTHGFDTVGLDEIVATHRGHQRAFAGRHAPARDDHRRSRRLRPPAGTARPAAPARALPRPGRPAEPALTARVPTPKTGRAGKRRHRAGVALPSPDRPRRTVAPPT